MDWVRFLEENNIHFVTRGPNTKRGEVSVQCPMCGIEDPSEHLGINLQTGKWGCHRDGSHRGKSSRTLIKAVLGCSSQQAGMIVRQYSHSDPDSLEAALAVLEADNNDVAHPDEDLLKQIKHQQLGPQFKDFSAIKARGITKRFFNYLADRGYDDPYSIIDRYDLKCALTGRYKDRIIIPIRQSGELLGWTSRAIGAPKNAPRYLASSENVKTTVFNFDELKKGGERLFIVEGPFDAMRIDNHGFTHTSDYDEPVDYRATCTFGTSLAISQLALLRALVGKYKEAWILFDHGAEGPAHNLASWLNVKVAQLPTGIDDPGELKLAHMRQLDSPNYDGYFPIFGGLSELVATTLKNRSAHLVGNIMRNNAALARMGSKPRKS